MSEGRWVLLIASEVGGTDSVSDRAMERLVDAIRKRAMKSFALRLLKTDCRW